LCKESIANVEAVSGLWISDLEMQTSRPDTRSWMSSHNSDQPKPRNLMTTSQLVQGSPASALSRNSAAFFDSPGLHGQDQFVDPCSMWRLGCSSDQTTLEQPHGVIEKRGQLVHGCYFVKAEEELDFFQARMALNLAGAGTTTYSGGASQETGHGNRFCRTGISSCAGSQIPQCQAEGCKANLSSAKHYHRRHKVCELHSKASTVVVAGFIQRFCQQCSRFHPRSEFDEGKRSCRKRLADHNRRRRKPQPNPCTASQCQAGTTGLQIENQKTKGSPGHNTTGVQITPNINTSTSTTPSLISSVPMMMFPNTYKGQIPVLQGTSNDKKSCVEFLYASIAQTGSDLSLEGRIVSDNQIDSSEYELLQPCSLRSGLLGSEITGRFSRPAPVDIQYSQSHISMKNSNSNLRVIESSKSSLNLKIFSTSNDTPAALSSMKNGGSNWILNGSSAEGVRTYDKIHESAQSTRSAYDPTPRNDAIIKWDEV